MTFEKFDFLNSLNYVDYDINEEQAIGYYMILPREELAMQLYVKSVAILIQFYVIGYIVFVIIKRKKLS